MLVLFKVPNERSGASVTTELTARDQDAFIRLNSQFILVATCKPKHGKKTRPFLQV